MRIQRLLGLVTTLALSLTFALTGCNQVGGPGPGPGGGDDDPTPDARPNNPGGGDDCANDNNCVCPQTQSCEHACVTGTTECHVQGAAGQRTDITCDRNLECHVQCQASSGCEVECGNSVECHVRCPATGCTVTNCVGPGCAVTCGTFGQPTRNGSTATCP
jgi:hypothetical protein